MIQKFGLMLFIAAFGLFIGTLGMNHFILTNEILEKNIKSAQLADAQKQFAPIFGKNYSNLFSFASTLNAGTNALNKVYDSQQAWDKKIYDDTLISIIKASANGYLVDNQWLMFFLTFGLSIIGALLFIIPENKKPAGIKNNGIYFNPATSRKWLGIVIGTFLILFYICLYFKPQYISNWIMLVDPISKLMNGGEASRWFMYGFLYTLSILVMGIRYIIKYRHSKYQIIRTLSIMFFQTCIAFILPEILSNLNLPAVDLKNMWPLDYSFFFNYRLDKLMAAGTFGIFLLAWGIVLFVVGVPIMVYFLGKRWYCSWVCGCGGLAETLGDPFRQLSDKSLKAWKIERYLIHSVLAFAIIMTIGVLYTYFTGSYNLLGFIPTEWIKSSYGFLIGSIFAGVIGTGFYPLMGSRVWCRFGCPLAAYLGIIQRFKSKFRITTNGGQCISCGNCSTYCEMGIDVRAYAQKGQDIVRSSCVGCGVCSAVCPRGVLNLENAETASRIMIAPDVLLGNKIETQKIKN
jgi:ferredoxin-type protein NapH